MEFSDKIRFFWFDMDHTLIDNDCDVSWKYFLVEKRLADPERTAERTEYFFQQYLRGTLDQAEFLQFQLAEFAGHTESEMQALAVEHFETIVKPRFYPQALDVVREAQARGLPTAIVTSTNQALARPLAEYLNVDCLFGAEMELQQGRYTGKISGVYPVGLGKKQILLDFCKKNGCDPLEFAYFGDSINDAEILGAVGFPHAVNPGEALRRLAQDKHWKIVAFASAETA